MKRNFPGRRIGSSERREIGASGLSTSWADCLSHLCARVSHVCTQLLEELPSRAQCVREAQDAATALAREGIEVPEWSRFTAADCRAPQPVDPEVGEWTHGWQFHASIARNTLFATSVHLPPLSTDHQALRASQRGPCASRHFSSLPTSQETTFTAEEFRTLLLVRLHLPLHMDASLCKCGEPLDFTTCADRSVDASRDSGRGVHGANLPRSRSLREGEPAASRSKHRGIIVNSLAFWEASKSPLTPPWSQRWRVGARRGVASKGIHEAEQDNRRKYAELLPGTRCHQRRHFLAKCRKVQLSRCRGSYAVQPNCCSFSDGQHCWLAPSNERTLPTCWGSLWGRALVSTGRRCTWATRTAFCKGPEARTLVSQSTVTSWSPWLQKKRKIVTAGLSTRWRLICHS